MALQPAERTCAPRLCTASAGQRVSAAKCGTEDVCGVGAGSEDDLTNESAIGWCVCVCVCVCVQGEAENQLQRKQTWHFPAAQDDLWPAWSVHVSLCPWGVPRERSHSWRPRRLTCWNLSPAACARR